MKCAFFETWLGPYVCFFGNKYLDTNIKDITEQINESPAIIVVSSEKDYLETIDLIKSIHHISNIFIDIVGCSQDYIISNFLQEKQNGRIKKLIVSTIHMYNTLQYDDVIIGYEQWKLNDFISSLRDLDDTVSLV